MRLIPTDEQVKNWINDKKRYLTPIILLLLPVALSKGDWSQIRVMIMFLSMIGGAAWVFFLMLSDKPGKGLLPDFSLKPLLEKAEGEPISAAIVVAAFFMMFCVFLLVVAFMVVPR